MKTIVAGSRTFNNFEYLKEVLKSYDISEVVSGTARGTDILGEKYAIQNFINIKKFPANWDKFGKGAGYIRNTEMGKYADFAIIFWDGHSKGSKHMIDIMKKLQKPYKIINF